MFAHYITLSLSHNQAVQTNKVADGELLKALKAAVWSLFFFEKFIDGRRQSNLKLCKCIDFASISDNS